MILAWFESLWFYFKENAISRGLDIVVGTPGRVNDLIDQHVLKLDEIEHVVLDEVDRMLDMGFQDIVNTILSHCYREGRQEVILFLTVSQMTKFGLFYTERVADDNLKFDKHWWKLSKSLENTVGKWEIARCQQFLLFLQSFQKTCAAGT